MNKHSADAFLDACEAAGPLQVEMELADEATQQLLIHQPFALIGRHPRADVRLDDPQVSRRHAYLQVLGGFVYCIDLHSRTGTHWEDGSERRSDWFGLSQVVKIGPCRLRLIKGGREGIPAGAEILTPLESGDRGAGAPPEVVLEFLNARTIVPPWPMNRPVVLMGAAAECKVRMRDLQVSGFHCSLVNTRKGLWAVDLCGRGGIAVNGVSLRMARLDDGDQLQVGDITVRVRCPQPRDNSGTHPFPFQVQTPPEVSVEAAGQVAYLPAVIPPAGLPAVNSTARSETALVPERQQVPVQQNVNIGEQLLSSVMNQFSVMQQQMFDQFQQTMSMMVQMFSGLHRDQMGLLRQELDRVQELTQELTMLQAELAGQSATPAGPRPAVATKFEMPARRLAQTSIPLPEPSEPSPAGAVPVQPPQPVAKAEETGNSAGPAAPVAAAAAPAVPVAAAAPSTATPEENVHGWLTERIAAIQQERQSRWQKIRDFLLKNPS
jgi:pSer/pThr/pTyr-binding forkhead associated (FHA) protein